MADTADEEDIIQHLVATSQTDPAEITWIQDNLRFDRQSQYSACVNRTRNVTGQRNARIGTPRRSAVCLREKERVRVPRTFDLESARTQSGLKVWVRVCFLSVGQRSKHRTSQRLYAKTEIGI